MTQNERNKLWMRKDRAAHPEKYLERGRVWDLTHTKVYLGKTYYKKYYPAIYARQREGTILLQRLKDKPCMDCGDTLPTCCMQFDHRDPTTKLHDVSRLRGGSRRKLLDEVKKCDVVCANCHFIRTNNRKAQRYGWMLGSSL